MQDNESLEAQVDRLASFILREFPDHLAWQFSEGACDKAMRILCDFKKEMATIDRSCPTEQGDSAHGIINDPNGGR